MMPRNLDISTFLEGGWTIEKDTAQHGGRKWKLKDNSGRRVASLDENGKVLGK